MGVWELSVPSLKLVCNSKIILKYKVKKKKKRQDQQSWSPAVALGLWLCPGEARGGRSWLLAGQKEVEMDQHWEERQTSSGGAPSPRARAAARPWSFAGWFVFFVVSRVSDLQRGLHILSGPKQRLRRSWLWEPVWTIGWVGPAGSRGCWSGCIAHLATCQRRKVGDPALVLPSPIQTAPWGLFPEAALLTPSPDQSWLSVLRK